MSCAPASTTAPVSTETNTPLPTATFRPEPTTTFTPEPTSTPMPIPLKGKLFFDMNGSGLPDEATFYYDSSRLTDDRQPLQPDLLKAISAYAGIHPELKDGDVITIVEPGLSNYQVCISDSCVTTDEHGSFSIQNPSTRSSSKISIIDPNSGISSLAMRFINKWNSSIVIEPYEMNGAQVPEQHLNDTTITAIEKGTIIIADAENIIGLTQGFLTLPYRITDANLFGMSTYYDLDTRMGSVRNFAGSPKQIFDPAISAGLEGTGDTHVGIDYEGPEGLFIVNPSGGEVNGVFFNNSHILVTGLDGTAQQGYGNSYGHLKTVLVTVGETIYRGQITSVNGKTNTSHPHLHYSFTTNLRQLDGKDDAIDPYMDLVENLPYWAISQSNYNNELSEILIGSPGYWTVVNLPIFP